MVNREVCKKKYLSWVYGVDRKNNLSLGITVRHHSASLVMPNSDPRERFFYPQHTPMKDTYTIIHVVFVQIVLMIVQNVLSLNNPQFITYQRWYLKVQKRYLRKQIQYNTIQIVFVLEKTATPWLRKFVRHSLRYKIYN